MFFLFTHLARGNHSIKQMEKICSLRFLQEFDFSQQLSRFIQAWSQGSAYLKSITPADISWKLHKQSRKERAVALSGEHHVGGGADEADLLLFTSSNAVYH